MTPPKSIPTPPLPRFNVVSRGVPPSTCVNNGTQHCDGGQEGRKADVI